MTYEEKLSTFPTIKEKVEHLTTHTPPKISESRILYYKLKGVSYEEVKVIDANYWAGYDAALQNVLDLFKYSDD